MNLENCKKKCLRIKLNLIKLLQELTIMLYSNAKEEVEQLKQIKIKQSSISNIKWKIIKKDLIAIEMMISEAKIEQVI